MSNERSIKAKAHTEDMANRYAQDIAVCIRESRLYGGPSLPPLHKTQEKKPATVKAIKATTDGALMKLPDDGRKIALLNFASYKAPGGLFLEGAMAQEEALCHVSFLYNVISKIPSYYEWNGKNLNKGLYTNRAIYTPYVVFESASGKKAADVITCAAPNRSVLVQYNGFTEEENLSALKSRIEFVRDVALSNNVEVIILGAWGCGVFSQDPTTVARLFRDAFKYTGIECIYAIPDDRTFNSFVEGLKR